jgi:hypothetical protein
MTTTTTRIIVLTPITVIFLLIIRLIINNPAYKTGFGKNKEKQPSKPVLIPGPKQLELEQERSKATYAKLWEKNENRENALKELQRIRQEVVARDRDNQPDESIFRNKEIGRFYIEHVYNKQFFKGIWLRAAIEVLKFLDTHGTCPSVVNRHADEPERGYNSRIFSALKEVRLFEHSINVALEMLKLVPQDSPGVPRAVITALTHDFGKITKYYDPLHSTGTHPFLAIFVMEQLFELKKVPKINDIVEAIVNHHSISESQLGKNLKRCDQAARRFEIAEFEDIEAMYADKPVNKCADNAFKSSTSTRLTTQKVKSSIQAANLKNPGTKHRNVTADLPGTGNCIKPTPPDIFGEASCVPSSKDVDLLGAGSFADNHRRGQNLQQVDIPWFCIDKLLREINPVVNRMQGGSWNALSVADGIVYVRPDLIFLVAQKLCDNSIDIQIAQTDFQIKDNIIFSMVSKCRQAGILESRLFSEKHYGSIFVVNPGTRNTHDAYLTPFKATAWSNDISTFERRKSGQLAYIKTISPKYVLENI